MLCTHCKYDYSPELLNSASGVKISGPICGICYLELSNAIHGTMRPYLRGPIAEQLRLAAIAARANGSATKGAKV